MYGVVLAGGKASRMPNKLWLYNPQGGFVIESAIRYLNKFIPQTRIGVVVRSTETDYDLIHLAYPKVFFIEQTGYSTASISAIRTACDLLDDEILVACGDTIIDPKEGCPEPNTCFVTPRVGDQIDRYDLKTKLWASRHTEGPAHQMAGIVRFDHEHAPIPDDDTWQAWMNRTGIVAEHSQYPTYDCGTPELYKDMLYAHSCF